MSTAADENIMIKAGRENAPYISFVIPCFKSEKTIGTVVTMTHEIMNQNGRTHEFILVNDCSGQATFDAIEELSVQYEFVRGIDLAQNVGQQMAVLAGLRMARGELTVVMDDDLQTHPTQVMKLITALEEGYDIAFARYPEVKESSIRKAASVLSSNIAPILTGRPRSLSIGSFYAMKRFVREGVVQYAGVNANIQITSLKFTSHFTNVVVDHYDRVVGSSGYTFAKLIRTWASLLNYSDFAPKLSLFVAILSGGVSVLLLVLSIVLRSGACALAAAILLADALLGLVLAMLAVQVFQTLFTETRIPQYSIRRTVGFSSERRPRHE